MFFEESWFEVILGIGSGLGILVVWARAVSLQEGEDCGFHGLQVYDWDFSWGGD